MVTLVDRRRVVLAALFLVLGVAGLGLYARAFAPVLREALGTSLEAATTDLAQLGWAQAVAATDRRSFVRNCAFLNREGCARGFRRAAWAAFKPAVAAGYGELRWPHAWAAALASTGLGVGLFAARKRSRPLFDAHFAAPGEVKPLLADLGHPATVLLGTLRGRYLGLTADLKGPGRVPHTLVIAPPDSGKSVGLIGVLLGWRQAAVVVDVKGELRAATGRWRHLRVGPVYTLSPDGRGARFDPIAELLRLDPDAAEAVAHFLTYDPDDHPKFFAAQAKPALLAAVRSAQLAKEPVLPHLDALLKRGHQGFVRALHGQADPEIDAHLTQYLGMPPAEFPEASFTDTRGPVFSVWQTLLERLGPFRRAGVLDLMSGSDFAAEDLLKPCTLYLAWPEADLDADAKPLALVLHSLITCLCTLADRRGGRLPAPVLLALDEAPRYVVPALPKYLATMQGRGLSALMYAQSSAQFAVNYGARNAHTIQSTATVTVYLRPQLEDAERIVRQLGTVTLPGERRSRRRGGDDVRTEHDHQRPLLSVDEVMRLKRDQMLVLTGVHRPVLAERLRYYADPRLKGRAAGPPLLLPPREPRPDATPAPQKPQPGTAKKAPGTFHTFDEAEL